MEVINTEGNYHLYFNDKSIVGNIESIASTLQNHFATMMADGESVYFRLEKPSRTELYFEDIHYGDIYILWDNKVIIPKTTQTEIIDSEEEQAETIVMEETDATSSDTVLIKGTELTNKNYLYVAYGESLNDIVMFKINYIIGERYLKITNLDSEASMNFLLYSNPEEEKAINELKEDITDKVKNIFEKLKIS